MKLGWKRPVLWAAGVAAVCLLGVASVRGQAGAAEAPLMTDDLYTSVQLFKGIPVDTFLDAMGMFASSLGTDCTYCHVKAAALDRAEFATVTPLIQRARQMIVMMRTINETNFRGEPSVTCFTCHRGSFAPVTAPSLALQYGTPDDNPNVMDFVPETRISVEQVFDRYIEALGGEERLAGVTSFVARGTYAGYDTGFEEYPVEIFAVAPNQRTWTVATIDGASPRVFDGNNGWRAGPDAPAPVLPLTAGNLDIARMEALIAFPAGIRQAFDEWEVGTTFIDDREVQLVQGTRAGQLPLNLYFDAESGLLVRMVRWNSTPVGPVPLQVNYTDYRDVAGVKTPFSWTFTQTHMEMTIQLSEVQPNVPVDAARFDRPVPGPPLVR
jgi:hypothetical protein